MSSSKPFSLSLGGSSTQKKPSSAPSSNGNKNRNAAALPRRPHHHLHDDSDDGEDDTAPVHEAVTEFDAVTGTAIPADRSHEKRELVIPVTSSNNWRDRPGVSSGRRGKKNLLPREVQAIQEAAKRGEIAGDNVEREGPRMEYGLCFAQNPGSSEVAATAEVAVEGQTKDAQLANGMTTTATVETASRAPMTQDEIALNALIRESKGDTEPRSDLVIASAGGDGERYDESTSFKADVAARPEPATLDQYNAIPVEEFGAALLRGMGWKEGQAVGRGKYSSSSSAAERARVPERRPGFLGIGAKDSGKGGAEAELGAWGKAAMRKGSRKAGQEDGNAEGVYMPVMMRNTATGEFVTEEELTAKKKEALKEKRDEDEWKERRDRNLERSGRDRDRERDSRRRGDRDGDDRDSRRSSRRDRSRSSGDRHSRRRKYDDDDDRYYRDRRYRDEDRHSSSSSRHGRTRDRDRDHDRDDSHRRRRRDDR